MGLFEGRSRVKRATTAPVSNLALDEFITSNKLGKRASKARLEPPEPEDVLTGRRVNGRINGGFLAASLRSSHRRGAGDGPPEAGNTPLTNGHGERPLTPPAARKHKIKHRSSEVQKLMVDADCEILQSKLRHVPGRVSAVISPALPPPPAPPEHRNGERPRRRRRSPPPWLEDSSSPTLVQPAKKRPTLSDLFLRDNLEYYKVEILSGKLRSSSRRLSGGSDADTSRADLDAPFVCDSGDMPEDSCDSFRVVRRSGAGAASVRTRRTRFGPCGTPHGCRPVEPPDGHTPAAILDDDTNDADVEAGQPTAQPQQIDFAFEVVPEQEPWFQTYVREHDGGSVLEDVSSALATARGELGPRLPYQMSQEELYPPESTVSSTATSAGTSDGLAAAGRPKPRRVRQLRVDGPRLSPRCHASTRAARVSVDAADGVAVWDSSLEQVQLVAASIDSLLTEAQQPRDPCSLAATVGAAGRPRRRRRTASLSETVFDGEVPPHLAGVPLSMPETPELGALLQAVSSCSPPVACASTGASVGSAQQRRVGKRRKNRTGWPRGKSRRPTAAAATVRCQRAVSRAAAAVRCSRVRRRSSAR